MSKPSALAAFRTYEHVLLVCLDVFQAVPSLQLFVKLLRGATWRNRGHFLVFVYLLEPFLFVLRDWHHQTAKVFVVSRMRTDVCAVRELVAINYFLPIARR